MCGLLRYNLYGTRDAATILGGGTGIDAQRSQVDEGMRVRMCVERPYQGRGRRGNRARRRHHNLELFIKMISKKYEIRK